MQKTTDIPNGTTTSGADQTDPKLPVTPKPRREPSALQGRLARDHGLNFF